MHRVVDCGEQDVELLALSLRRRMRARLAGEAAELVAVLTRPGFLINRRQPAIYLRAVPNKLLHERPFIRRILGR